MRTAHFELLVAEGSFAERRAPTIGAELESLRSVLGEVLGLEADQLLDLCRVYLGDTPPAFDSGKPENERSRIVASRGVIWAVYRPDAPGINLDQALVRLLVLRAAGTDLNVVPALLRGLTRLCGARATASAFGPEESRQLLRQFEKRPPPIGALLARTEPSDDPGAAIALPSFLSFLLERGGPVQFRAFVVASAAASIEHAINDSYQTSVASLQKAWWKSVRTRGAAGAGGILRFIRGSLHYLRPYWKEEIAIFLFLGIELAFQQILPRAQALLIDRAILPRDLRYLLGLAIFLFVMVFAVIAAGVLRGLLTTRVSESVLRGLRGRMFEQLQLASHRFYSRIGSGDIISRFGNDLRSVEQGLTSTLTSGLFLILSLVISIVHILLISLPMATIVLVTLPLFFLTTRVLGPRANRASLEYSQDQAAITGAIQENLAAQPVIKAYNLGPTMTDRFRDQAQALYRSAFRLFFLSSLFGVSANLLSTSVQVGMLALGGYFVLVGQLQLGSLIEFLSLQSLVIGPVQSITSILQSIQIATASMDRVEEILNLEPDVRDLPDATQLRAVANNIRLENITFSYGGGQAQLEDVSLEIPAGTTAAFVGPSGSGKSTILNLLMRFYDPDQGRVVFDGQDLRDVSLKSVREQIAVVFQESFLFNTSIRQNIRYGREDATDAAVEEAARQAAVHDAILELPQGYETVVGERGGSLSGGQRQRLAIARACLRGASVLIFDEATSALDPSTENAILQSLAAQRLGRTTVWVTHRLTSASTADQIFVLDRGRLVEQGTHSELLRLNGLYQRLFEEQSGTAVESQRALEVAYLRGVPVFAALETVLLNRVAGFLRSEGVVAGETVVEVGAEADKLYLIVSGEFEVLAPAGGQPERVLALLGIGDYFGEAALLRDIPRTATVRARTAGQLLSLERQALLGLFEIIPDLRDQLEAGLAKRQPAIPAKG